MFIGSKKTSSRFFCLSVSVCLAMIGTIHFAQAEETGSYEEDSFSYLNNKPIRTYVIAGQSNADGYGLVDGALEYGALSPYYGLYDIERGDLMQVNDRVAIYKGRYDIGSGSWHHLSPGLGIIGNGNRFGPELSFGYELQKIFQEQVALIKYAKGAISLAKDWNPDYSRINQYDFLIQTIYRARAEAEAAGVKLNIVGLLWMQGEDDASDAGMAENYQQNLARFISSIRMNLGLPRLEVYIGTIADSTVWTYRQQIWSAQEAVAAKDERVFLVDGTDVPLLMDDGAGAVSIHYSTEGQVELGERFAEAVLNSSMAVLETFK